MPLDILGSVKVTLKLSGIVAQHMVFVCGGLAPEVLVGIDFLKTHKRVLDFDTETVNTKEGPSKIVFGHLDKVCRITVAKTITLLPNMVADIPCQVQEANGLDELVGMLEPSDKFTERYAAGAFRTAVTIKGGRVPVQVFNPSNQPIRVYRCSNIGGLDPLESKWESSKEGHTSMGYKIVSSVSSEKDVSVLPGVK